jgi:hypothetical protein
VKALERVLSRNLGVLRDQRLVRDVEDAELVLEALGVAEAHALAVSLGLDSRVAQPRGPEVERRRPADAPDDPVDHALTGTAARGARILEERQVEAGLRVLVPVEEVIDRGVVLVDGPLDHPKPEDARVEVDVGLGVGRDRRDVMDPVQLHRVLPRK